MDPLVGEDENLGHPWVPCFDPWVPFFGTCWTGAWESQVEVWAGLVGDCNGFAGVAFPWDPHALAAMARGDPAFPSFGS